MYRSTEPCGKVPVRYIYDYLRAMELFQASAATDIDAVPWLSGLVHFTGMLVR